MNGSRPLVQIRHDLVTAVAYQRRYRGRASSDALVLAMRTANDAEVEQLRTELRAALSAAGGRSGADT